jgi:hypothetical protein
MNKEPIITQKTTGEKIKDSFGTALMSAGIILAVLLLLWIPFKLIPAVYSHGSNFVSTSLSSLFISGDATSTNNTVTDNKNKDSALVINDQATTSNTTNTGKTYTKPTSQTQAVSYYGKPDLEVTLIGTGIIDPSTKQFIETTYAGSADEIAIRFEVKNIGTNVSGAWRLRIVSPSRTTPYYDSPYQVSIKPGDRMIFTASFDSPITTGINTAYITADPLNYINEISENNNEITVPININGTNYSYNNNYNYGSNVASSNTSYGTTYTWSDMNVNCYANPQTSYVGSPIAWYATASGGNGYYTYSWTGSDLLSSNLSTVSKTYYSEGTKTATVTVTSNGTSVTKQCTAYIY